MDVLHVVNLSGSPIDPPPFPRSSRVPPALPLPRWRVVVSYFAPPISGAPIRSQPWPASACTVQQGTADRRHYNPATSQDRRRRAVRRSSNCRLVRWFHQFPSFAAFWPSEISVNASTIACCVCIAVELQSACEWQHTIAYLALTT